MEMPVMSGTRDPDVPSGRPPGCLGGFFWVEGVGVCAVRWVLVGSFALILGVQDGQE